jgi:uncharacterized protein YlxW (UPF0749 family)
MTPGLAPRRADRDDSLSLLWRIVDDAIDPGYAAAVRRGSRPVTAAGLGHSLVLAVALLALGALIAAAVLQTQRGAPAASRTRADLVERVETATQQADDVAATVDDLAKQTTELREAALSGTAADQLLNDQVASLASVVGQDAVTGPGVEVVLTDGPPAPASGTGPDLARVLDRDLQLVVNGLFAAGAEAVSINGQRITSLSAIRGAGDAVLVGYRPLSPPYVVSAIGESDTLERDFVTGSAGSSMQDLSNTYGIGFDTEQRDELLVPGVPDLMLRYVTPGVAQ